MLYHAFTNHNYYSSIYRPMLKQYIIRSFAKSSDCISENVAVHLDTTWHALRVIDGTYAAEQDNFNQVVPD